MFHPNLIKKKEKKKGFAHELVMLRVCIQGHRRDVIRRFHGDTNTGN